MYVAPKKMRRADAPVPAHVLAIAEAQRMALAERIAAQAAAKDEAPLYMPSGKRSRRQMRRVAIKLAAS